MHIEVQVALNFVISYLYNKLPRRRVNIFGEELEKALKDKFSGHWYPEKPFKGSAFRCLKTGDPVDAVLERAARESGVPIQDVLENLPQELAVWVDPGEVSYRIGEKGAVKVLFSEQADPHDESSADREVTRTFNPEAQCFRPIEAVGSSLGGLSLSPGHRPPSPFTAPASSVAQPVSAAAPAVPSAAVPSTAPAAVSTAPSPTAMSASSYKGSPSPVAAFIPRSTAPLTFTTATFAQTKFGSTKLKTSSKRANRMSPTEFSNYIKQRAIQQQIHHHHHHQQQHHPPPPAQTSPAGRSMSPGGGVDPTGYFFQAGPTYHPQFAPHQSYIPELYPTRSYLDPHQFYGAATGPGPLPGASPASGGGSQQDKQQQQQQQLLEGLNSFGLGSVAPYPPSPFQHLLVAN